MVLKSITSNSQINFPKEILDKSNNFKPNNPLLANNFQLKYLKLSMPHSPMTVLPIRKYLTI